MTPQEVKDRVVEMEIWDNAVWVNHSKKLFFVPIWRNGNTTFMNDVAEQFDFTLEKNLDLNSYTGFTIIRNPVKRLHGQIWRACVNHNYEIEYVVNELINNQNPVDIHLYSQASFLKSYNISYYLDLDNLQYTDNSFINDIIDIFKLPKEIKDSQKSNEFSIAVEAYLNTHSNIKLLEQYYKEDFDLYYTLAPKTDVGILGLGKIGSILKSVLERAGITVSAYDPKKFTDTLSHTVNSDIIWICVDTNTAHWGDDPDDQPSDYDTVNLKTALGYATGKPVIIGSTVSPGTCSTLQHDAPLYYMPFLISQGEVEHGLIEPDAWFIGSPFDTTIVETIVKKFSSSKIKTGTFEEIELVKVLYNSWIIQKINFANWAGDLARAVGNANGNKIMSILADSDKLITSSAYMRAGWGDGGPCHPRDNLMLSWLNQKLGLGYDPAINQHNTRLAQAKLIVNRAKATKLPVCILGKSYKSNVIDTTGSYSILVAKLLVQEGVSVCFEDTNTNGEDYCYILAHGKLYNHNPSDNSVVINMWEE